MASLDELSGRWEVYVRPSSSYAEHIAALNKRFVAEGKPPLKIAPAPEILEDGDILEMVSAGLAPAKVVDDFTADLYTQVFPNLRKHSDIASQPGEMAWAFRKGSPKLAAAVNAFVKTHQQGSLAGNVLINKYLKTTKWVKNARSDEDRQRRHRRVRADHGRGPREARDLLHRELREPDGLRRAAGSERGPMPWIESFGNEYDIVARLGILAPRQEHWGIHIAGPAYVRRGAWGHLLNEH